jgi:hypothetical protein
MNGAAIQSCYRCNKTDSPLPGAPPANSTPSAYVRSDGINAVVYPGRDGHIYELFIGVAGWQVEDLTTLASG